jgi:hypothetical protein
MFRSSNDNQQNTQQNSTQDRQEYAAAWPELPEKDFNWVILARSGWLPDDGH